MKTLNVIAKSLSEIEEFIDSQEIKDSPALLIQVFSGWTKKEDIQSVIDLLVSRLPSAYLIGSTTDGEISNGKVSTNLLSLSFSAFEKTKLIKDCIPLKGGTSFDLGFSVASSVVGNETKAVILFAAGLGLDGEAIINGVKEYDDSVIVTGGMAGDNSLFETPYVFTKEGVCTDALIGLSLNSDDLIVNTDYCLDWELIGKTMVVTRSEGNRIYEIDGIPAVEVYKKYLGEETASSLPSSGSEFPLVIDRDGLKVARAAMQKHDDLSLTMAGGVNTGDKVKFAFGSPDMILKHTNSLNQKLLEKPVESIFVYSCMGRRRFMPDLIEKEILPLQEIAPTSGFFTYGEFYHNEDKNELLNQTMTILALSESGEFKPIDRCVLDQHNYNSERNYTSTVRALSFFVNSTFTEMQGLNIHLERQSKKSQEQDKMLMQQSRYAAMGEMINAIAHQWRQPINALNLVIANIQDAHKFGKLDEAFLDKSVTKSNRLIQKMSSTIDDFRDFFKPEKEKSEFLIEDVVQDTISLLDGVLKNYDIYVHADYEADVTAMGYPNEFSQAVLNVLNNAKDAMVEKNVFLKEIYVKIRRDDSNVYLCIEDTAGGIPEDIKGKIFDPYFTTKGSAEGTGIGLYMTKSIIDDHMNGSISVENGEKGAVFTISIPVKQ